MSEAERRLKVDQQAAMLNALPAHIALLDAEGRIAAHNQSWEYSEAPSRALRPEAGARVSRRTQGSKRHSHRA